ncbi:MAG: hypothetical protein WA945_06300 [Arcobacteraceae bacterium]
MLQKYTPPYFFILSIIAILNILFSSYFVSFFLAGVVFKIFAIAIRKEFNYLLIFSVITFLIIENTQGLKLFSLTLISFGIYYLIIPRIKHLFSSVLMLDCLFIFFFYVCFYLMVLFYSIFELPILITFGINFIIDILIVGFLL